MKRQPSLWARDRAETFPLVLNRGEEAALAQFLDEIREELLQPRAVRAAARDSFHYRALAKAVGLRRK